MCLGTTGFSHHCFSIISQNQRGEKREKKTKQKNKLLVLLQTALWELLGYAIMVAILDADLGGEMLPLQTERAPWKWKDFDRDFQWPRYILSHDHSRRHFLFWGHWRANKCRRRRYSSSTSLLRELRHSNIPLHRELKSSVFPPHWLKTQWNWIITSSKTSSCVQLPTHHSPRASSSLCLTTNLHCGKWFMIYRMTQKGSVTCLKVYCWIIAEPGFIPTWWLHSPLHQKLETSFLPDISLWLIWH